MQYAPDHPRQPAPAEKLGATILAWRTCSGLLQTQAAERLGVSQPTLSAWENGRTPPSTLQIARLAELYGIGADEVGAAVKALTAGA